MDDGRSITPEPTTIPGWRLILSDAGRLWASREEPFSLAAFRAGAERTIDADNLEALRAETGRQETIAKEANAQAAVVAEIAAGQTRGQAAGQVIS